MKPMAMMQIKNLLDQFKKNHPKVLQFFATASKRIQVGSVIEVNITDSDGKTICTNMRVTEDDIALIQQLSAQAK